MRIQIIFEEDQARDKPYPGKQFWVLQTFDRKRFAKVKTCWVRTPFIIEFFLNVLGLLFIKR